MREGAHSSGLPLEAEAVVEEKQVRLAVVLAGAGWLAGAVIVALGIILRTYGVPAIGLICCMVGAVLNIRCFLGNDRVLLRDAFEGGREFERAKEGPTVRSLH